MAEQDPADQMRPDPEIGIIPDNQPADGMTNRPIAEEPAPEKPITQQPDVTADMQHTDPAIQTAIKQFPGILGVDDAKAKYIIKKIAGSGAGGTAFLIQRSSDNVRFVAKMTDLSHVADPKRRLYARNEIHCLKQCDHFAIIKHHESCQNESGSHLLLIMELADAGDLSRAVKARAKTESYFQEHEVAFLFLQIVLAIHYIHQRNMLHRDIKSANVFILSCGITKLGDFGFSQQYHHSVSDSVAGTFCGTPFYLAPELWQRQAYSNRADVWSLGILLYEIAALRRPFIGRDLRALMNRVLECNPEPLPAMYSDSLQDLMMSILVFNPAQRPNTTQLLQNPYMQRTMQLFEGVIAENNAFDAGFKEQILRQVAQARTVQVPRPASALSAATLASNAPQQQQHQQQHAQGDASAVAFRGPIKKLGSRGWKDRILTLTSKSLTVSVEASRGGEEKSLGLEHVSGVLSVAPSQVEGREGAFLINTTQGSQVLFCAKDGQEREIWIAKILEVLAANGQMI